MNKSYSLQQRALSVLRQPHRLEVQGFDAQKYQGLLPPIAQTEKVQIAYPDGSTYSGNLLTEKGKNVAHGRGKLITAGKNTYEGRFIMDALSKGKLIKSNGDTYVGKFDKELRPHGRGVYEFANVVDKSRYEGKFRHGKRHGFGTMFYKDESYYQGQWEDDKRQGSGTLYINDKKKTRFEGYFDQDERRGV